MYQLWIVAGPNGSGKTTLTQRHLARRLPVVNPDDIALEMKGQRTDSPDTNVSAGREALLRQRRFLAEQRSFTVETTFSGNREIALMREAKAAGYKVNLIYLSTDSPMISVGRIKTRVRAGGHLVLTRDVVRRYQRSLAHLSEGIALADRAWLLDNSRQRLRLIASLERGCVKSMSNALPGWVRSARIAALDQAQGLSR
ncbi:AAA family ATPase [Magnetospirillum fulvum]|uniref:UDP-N-acetylglucosamine kinase n=1 Tax=Magnetospirillum fulvum MGU-K5 TaxID=1316936 RepID=S9SA84_MAGFU|nr:AAA family ATPase [Magnetospirillum fulvum]EPY00978.1 hypothetical protein K678_13393 [Magnetospirillum fulvum MGU-K5]